MAQEVFAAPAKHEMLAARAGQDKQKDHDIETFKHKAATVSSVVMHLVPAAQAATDAHHPKPPESKPAADVVVTTDGSLKWQNPKTLSNLADHIRDAHAPGGKVKPLVVAFEQSKPAPGDHEGHLSAKQVERLKQMMTCLADQHTHTEVDKALQEKAQLHVIPTDKQDRVQAPVLIAEKRHGGHDPSTGQWSGGNGSLYRPGQSENLVEPPASARAHLGSESKAEATFMKDVSAADRPQIKDFVDKLVWAISGNEGNYTTINPNDAGHGISIGIRQWNQKSGELPTLLQAWHDQDPTKFNAIFGRYAGSLLNERFVRGTNFHDQPGLMKEIAEALADKEFQQVQLNLARQFVVNSVQLGYDNGFRSELALADIADVINQCGSGGFSRALHRGMKSAGGEKESVVSMEHILQRPQGFQRLAALAKTFSPVTPAHIANS